MKPVLYFLMSWLVPGLGHYALKLKLKAAVFFVGILAMIGLGLAMHGGINTLYNAEPLTIIQFLGSLGNGLVYFVLKFSGLGVPRLEAFTYQYGMTYVTAAGFMNLLVAFNAAKVAKERSHV